MMVVCATVRCWRQSSLLSFALVLLSRCVWLRFRQPVRLRAALPLRLSRPLRHERVGFRTIAFRLRSLFAHSPCSRRSRLFALHSSIVCAMFSLLYLRSRLIVVCVCLMSLLFSRSCLRNSSLVCVCFLFALTSTLCSFRSTLLSIILQIRFRFQASCHSSSIHDRPTDLKAPLQTAAK